VVAAVLAKVLAEAERHYTYRFVFAPGTIGAIAWLAAHEDVVDRIRGGLVLACVGDPGPPVFKRSRRGDTELDRAGAHAMRHHAVPGEVIDFSPYGNDERQFCSPGFDLPVAAITRSGHDRSVRHHTSADDLTSIDPAALADSLDLCLEVLAVMEANGRLTSMNPKGEPQLGRRGLYRAFGGRAQQAELESALLWVMSMADGERTTLDVAERAGLPFAVVAEAVGALEDVGLVRRAPTGSTRSSGR
jgi:aminopeptidase-like protein